MFVLNKQAIKIYYKIRHRRGHGIHSPFVYNFIINVVENKHPFYAFNDIEEFIHSQTNQVHKRKKTNKLIFKTINYFNLRKILFIETKNGINILYGTAPSSEIKSICIEEKKDNREQASTLLHSWKNKVIFQEKFPPNELFDCIIMDMKQLSNPEQALGYILEHTHEKSVVILNNIRTNAHTNSLVQKTREDERIRISLDLFKTSIFFFDKKYYKRNYILSF